MEATLLMQLFPHLKDALDKDELPASFMIAAGSGQLRGKGTRGRPRFSGAARQVIIHPHEKVLVVEAQGQELIAGRSPIWLVERRPPP